MTKLSPQSAPDYQPPESAHAVRASAEPQRSPSDFAGLLASHSAPEDRAGAARRCADLTSLAAAWQVETEPAVRLALAAALADVLSEDADGAAAAALLEADHCTDAIRAEVARRTRDAERRRVAIATIRDEHLLASVVHLDTHVESGEGTAAYVVPPRFDVPVGEQPLHPIPAPTSTIGSQRFSLYVPRILQQHLADDPGRRCWTEEGSAAFVDVSGFTMLSEQLARKGREGAEQIAEVIGDSFESILEAAYDNGGSLLKFGGDSLLLWFSGERHASRACRATVMMRRALRTVGRINIPGAKVGLRMSQGVHSGRFHFFAVGASHFELLPVGPAWSRLVAMEDAARAGGILVSPETAAFLPSRCLGDARGPGRHLLREPNHAQKLPLAARPRLPAETLGRCLSPAVRRHVLAGGGTSEHRPVTVAFLRFEGTDALIERGGPEAAAEALDRLVSVVQEATERQGISFLASDVDADGGKLILTAGAPTVTGDDEERMLLALRTILAADLPLPVRIGVNRGSVFAGDIGPAYRRTYTVMGDAVNLTARLMAKAEPGRIYATTDVLDRSNTLFETQQLEPFTVKGKAQPVRAWSVGRAAGSRSRHTSLQDHSLVGRDTELAIVREALARSRAGSGRLVEIVGEAGIGKTRLLEALRDEAAGLRQLHAVCEAYTAHTPYSLWRELLREFMGFGRDDPEDIVTERLRDWVSEKAPELTPWLPLIAIAFDVDMPPTPEVEMLAERNRRTKLHEVVGRFLEIIISEPALIEIENVHQMDAASAELLASLVGTLDERPWLVGVTRRPSSDGFAAPESAAVTRIVLEPLALQDALRITHLATEQHPLPMHVLDTVAKRSGGNPQFLRDLLRAAIESGGVGGLPDSAEAAAMARIDALTPQDRALVRHAAVFGLRFHPRNLSWLADEGECPVPTEATWERLQELFDEEEDGYLRFRRSLLRDAAYEGLPYRLRRRVHGVVAARLEEELDDPEESAGILSLHYFVAGEYNSAWRYAGLGAKRAREVYAYVEAAELFARALESARRISDVAATELEAVHEAQAECYYLAAEFEKAADGYAAAIRLADEPLARSRLLLRRSVVEDKLGNYPSALRWAARARKAVSDLADASAARQAARTTSWYAAVLQAEGRNNEALRWAARAVGEAQAASDLEALGEAYDVMGTAFLALGKEEALTHFERSLVVYEQSGNAVRQAQLLCNLGVGCQAEGRWDEALSYYERGREKALQIGNTVSAAVTRINMAEILIDRGEVAPAEQFLRETLPMFKAAHYRYFVGACLWLLGRASLRASRHDEALKRLSEAREHFASVGAEEVFDIDAYIAECRLFMGEPAAALEIATMMLERAGAAGGVAKTAAGGVAKTAPLLLRVRAYAMLQRGQIAEARMQLGASLAAARMRRDLLETTRSLLAMIELDRFVGVEAPAEVLSEAGSLLARLKISTPPPVPSLARQT